MTTDSAARGRAKGIASRIAKARDLLDQLGTLPEPTSHSETLKRWEIQRALEDNITTAASHIGTAPGISGRYTDETRKRIVWQIVRDEVNFPRGTLSLEAALVSLLENLKHPQPKQFALIPVDGLNLRTGRLRVGPYRFLKLTQRRIDRYLARLPDDEILRHELEPLKDQTCFVFGSDAEGIIVRGLAEDQVQRALALLRYALFTRMPSFSGLAFGVAGEHRAGPRTTVVFSLVDGVQHRHMNQAEALERFLFNTDWIPTDDPVVKRLARIMADNPDRLSGLELAVVRAVQWVADATIQATRPNGCVCLTTALECCFSGDKDAPVTDAVANGVAASSGEAPDVAERLRARAVRLYDRRSDLVHGRRKDVTADEYRMLVKIVPAAVAWTLDKTDRFREAEDLARWIATLPTSTHGWPGQSAAKDATSCSLARIIGRIIGSLPL